MPAHLPDVLRRRVVCAAVLLPLGRTVGAATESAAPFVATPWSIVDEILTLAEVGARDFVVDLGSGDGRLVISAVSRYGARGGYGVDIDGALVRLANANAAQAGVADRVRFEERDLFVTDVRAATVVTVYLLPKVMARLERKLLAELAPGTRVVVNDYPFPTWQPVRVVERDSLDKLPISGLTLTQLYLYRVPAR
ncbi:MAG TPA: 50S ribosomal protein L11 methyltransferase [Casimicrobiaceae bacterium]|nr:50S ribosomal protein L11 methyltransferase [Casimicrobiaceae bacterium]